MSGLGMKPELASRIHPCAYGLAKALGLVRLNSSNLNTLIFLAPSARQMAQQKH
jgi:hypothetical protein